jgi:site-specific recombinase XerD
MHSGLRAYTNVRVTSRKVATGSLINQRSRHRRRAAVRLRLAAFNRSQSYRSRAGLTQPVHPHLFRHQMLTYLTAQGAPVQIRG